MSDKQQKTFELVISQWSLVRSYNWEQLTTDH